MLSVLRPAPHVLTGNRIIVREYGDDDAEDVYAAIQESVEHIRPWLPWYNGHQSVDDTLAYIRHTQAEYVLRDAFEMGIFSLSGHYLGGCALRVQDWAIPSFIIGYWIRQSEEGKGYVTEAAALLTDSAFEMLGAERVLIYCDARNLRSARVAERLGYTHEGTARRARRDTSGQLSDVLNYALLRHEYEALPEKHPRAPETMGK